MTAPPYRPRTRPPHPTPTSERIHAYCDRTGATLLELAHESGISERQVRRYARGHAQPRGKYARDLDLVLGKEIEG